MTKRPSVAAVRVIAAALAVALPADRAGAIDVDPSDFEPAPAGTTAAMVYGQYAQRSKLYSDGSVRSSDAQLRSAVALVRGLHYFDVAGVRATASVIAPLGSLSANGDISALGSTSGFGDPILLAGAWPINDPTSGRYLGVLGYLFVPVGQYDHANGLNLGNNRWEYAVQAGFVQRFAQRWSADVVADAAFFSSNTSFGPSGVTMKQDPQFQFQGYLSFFPTLATRVAVGLSELAGGERTVAAVSQHDAASTLKASVTFAAWFGGTGLQATIGRDLIVANGLKEDFRLNLRVAQVF